jgi:hypothetical protein
VTSEEAAGIYLIRCALLVALLGGLARTFGDPDLWGHLRFGGDILRDGLPSTDPYSFTSDVPWVNHEWLAEILMFLAWNLAGGAGLVGLKLAMITGTLTAVFQIVRHDRLTPVTRDLLAFVVMVQLWPRVFVVRPQLFSILLFAVLLWILRSVERGRPRLIWLVPAVLALWVNLHGGWIVGSGALLVWSAAGIARPATARVRPLHLIGCAALAVTATLVNPYGSGLWRFLLRTVGVDRPNINDWRPLLESGPDVLIPWTLTAVASCAALWRGGRQVPLPHAVIVVGLALASIRVNRLDVFFTLSTVMLLAPHLAPAEQPPVVRPWWTRRMRAAAALLTVALLSAGWIYRRHAVCVRLDGPWMPEREAGATIVQSALRGRLLTWFDWGQYAIWHFSPNLRVSIDGRRETVYSDAFVAQHVSLYFEPEAAQRLLENLRPDYAWLPVGLPLVDTLGGLGWQRLYTGARSTILARDHSAVLAPAVLAGPACFPGP